MTRRPRGRRLSAVLSAVFLAVVVVSLSPGPAAASAETDAERLAVDLINAQRTSAGLVPLRSWSSLASIAGTRAARMRDANVLSHSAGGDIGYQLDAKGVRWYSYGETIGYSYAGWASRAARDLVRLWMASPAHRALLMSNTFNYIGVGLAYRSSNGRTYGSVVMTESPDHSGARSWFTSRSISGGNDITWRWAGADLRLQTHTAGLRDYDVQVRIGSGSWRWKYNDTTRTSFTWWNRTHGVTYAVRVRATDRHGYAGAWKTYRVTLP